MQPLVKVGVEYTGSLYIIAVTFCQSTFISKSKVKKQRSKCQINFFTLITFMCIYKENNQESPKLVFV